jgi:8-oxo-dGTP diphosphatase
LNTKVYKNPTPTADTIIQRGSKILLIKRKKDPFKNMLALPGGFVNEGETVEEAAKREIREETTLEIRLLDILGVYSDPNRDPRKHVITTVFVGEIEGDKDVEPIAADDASEIIWLDLESVEKHTFGFDHKKIINNYLKWRFTRGTFWSTRDQ